MAVFSNAVPVAQSLLRSFLFGRILEHPKQMLRIVEQNAGWSNSSLDKSSLTVFVNLYTECRAVKEAENSIGSDCIVVSGVSRTLQARIKSMRQESATMIRVKSIYITSRHVTSNCDSKAAKEIEPSRNGRTMPAGHERCYRPRRSEATDPLRCISTRTSGSVIHRFVPRSFLPYRELPGRQITCRLP